MKQTDVIKELERRIRAFKKVAQGFHVENERAVTEFIAECDVEEDFFEKPSSTLASQAYMSFCENAAQLTHAARDLSGALQSRVDITGPYRRMVDCVLGDLNSTIKISEKISHVVTDVRNYAIAAKYEGEFDVARFGVDTARTEIMKGIQMPALFESGGIELDQLLDNNKDLIDFSKAYVRAALEASKAAMLYEISMNRNNNDDLSRYEGFGLSEFKTDVLDRASSILKFAKALKTRTDSVENKKKPKTVTNLLLPKMQL